MRGAQQVLGCGRHSAAGLVHSILAGDAGFGAAGPGRGFQGFRESMSVLGRSIALWAGSSRDIWLILKRDWEGGHARV